MEPSTSAAAGQVRGGGHDGHALRKAHGPATSAAEGILEKVSTLEVAYYVIHSRSTGSAGYSDTLLNVPIALSCCKTCLNTMTQY